MEPQGSAGKNTPQMKMSSLAQQVIQSGVMVEAEKTECKNSGLVDNTGKAGSQKNVPPSDASSTKQMDTTNEKCRIQDNNSESATSDGDNSDDTFICSDGDDECMIIEVEKKIQFENLPHTNAKKAKKKKNLREVKPEIDRHRKMIIAQTKDRKIKQEMLSESEIAENITHQPTATHNLERHTAPVEKNSTMDIDISDESLYADNGVTTSTEVEAVNACTMYAGNKSAEQESRRNLPNHGDVASMAKYPNEASTMHRNNNKAGEVGKAGGIRTVETKLAKLQLTLLESISKGEISTRMHKVSPDLPENTTVHTKNADNKQSTEAELKIPTRNQGVQINANFNNNTFTRPHKVSPDLPVKNSTVHTEKVEINKNMAAVKSRTRDQDARNNTNKNNSMGNTNKNSSTIFYHAPEGISTSENTYDGEWTSPGKEKKGSNISSTKKRRINNKEYDGILNMTGIKEFPPKLKKIDHTPQPRVGNTEDENSKPPVKLIQKGNITQEEQDIANSGKHMYRVNFELFADKRIPIGEHIQILFDRIIMHDPTAAIKCYLPGKPAMDITADSTISEMCWNKKLTDLYFWEIYHNNNKSPLTNHGTSTLYGKMRVISNLEFDTLKGRMLSWLTEQRHYIKKPYIQETRVSQLGVLIGSSPTQWRPVVQQQLEEAVKNEIGYSVKLDIQNQRTWIKNPTTGAKEVTQVLKVYVSSELVHIALKGLKSVLNPKVVSPVGRRMALVVTNVKSEEARRKVNALLGKQRYLLKNEKTTTSDRISDILKKVKLIDDTERTIQQIIVGLVDEDHKPIFTGAEKMGTSNKILFTYHRKNTYKARAAVDNICELVCQQTRLQDRILIADESKQPSLETYTAQSNAENQYLSNMLNIWDVPTTKQDTAHTNTANMDDTSTMDEAGSNDDYSMGSNVSWQDSIGSKNTVKYNDIAVNQQNTFLDKTDPTPSGYVPQKNTSKTVRDESSKHTSTRQLSAFEKEMEKMQQEFLIMREETAQRKRDDKKSQQQLRNLFTDMKDRGQEMQDMQKNQKQLGQEVCNQFKAIHQTMKEQQEATRLLREMILTMINNVGGLQNMQTVVNPSTTITLTPDHQEIPGDPNSTVDINMTDPEDETDPPYTDKDLPRGGRL